MDDRTFASATELTKEIRDRRIGYVELLDFYQARAERHNPALNAIVVWQVDQARERARAADAALVRGERWGPLHGIPMTVKESFNVAGLPTTFGNPLWKDNIAADNAFLNQEAAMNAFYEHDTDSIRFGYRCFDHRDGWTKLAEWTTEDAV